MAVIRLIDRQYFVALNDMLDQIYNEVSDRNWSWSELASRSGLAVSTVWSIGTRKTRYPQLRTVWKLARTVGGAIEFRAMRLKKAHG